MICRSATWISIKLSYLPVAEGSYHNITTGRSPYGKTNSSMEYHKAIRCTKHWPVETWLCAYCLSVTLSTRTSLFFPSLYVTMCVIARIYCIFKYWNSPSSTQVGVVVLEKVVSSVQVIVLLPFSRNLSSHDTVSTVLSSTGNVASVVSWLQAGSRPVHGTLSVGRVALVKLESLKQDS